MKQHANILCATCNVPVEAPESPQPTDKVRCPVCAQEDTVENVLIDARAHATHAATRKLERKMEKRGRSVRSPTPTRAPVKNLHWISNLAP